MRRKSFWAMVLAVGLAFLVTAVSGATAKPQVLGKANKASHTKTNKKMSGNLKAASKKIKR